MTSEKVILEKYRNLCARREYCSSEISRKLFKDTEGDGEMASRIVDDLVRDRFIDDSRYAGAFARDKAVLDGWGPIKIRFLLSGKGIGSDAVREALDSIDVSKADSKLDSLLRAKYKTLKGSEDAKLKLLKYALGRGYEYDKVSVMVNRLISNG